jgi:hypothetical protein
MHPRLVPHLTQSAELGTTETGYVESLCVFRTPASNIRGAGLRILTNVEPNWVVEAVMFHEDNDVLEYMKLDLVDLGNGTTKVRHGQSQ